MTKRRICVLVELDTEHPLLDPEAVDNSTTDATAALRQAVVDSLPDLVAVVAVMPVEVARLMTETHDRALRAIGGPEALRPPADYVPPHRRGL